MFLKNSIERPLATKQRYAFLHWLLIDHIRQVIQRVNLCVEIKRERESLAKLSDAELRDIGVHRGDADAESQRTFLDIPADRLSLDLDAGEERRSM